MSLLQWNAQTTWINQYIYIYISHFKLIQTIYAALHANKSINQLNDFQTMIQLNIIIEYDFTLSFII